MTTEAMPVCRDGKRRAFHQVGIYLNHGYVYAGSHRVYGHTVHTGDGQGNIILAFRAHNSKWAWLIEPNTLVADAIDHIREVANA